MRLFKFGTKKMRYSLEILLDFSEFKKFYGFWKLEEWTPDVKAFSFYPFIFGYWPVEVKIKDDDIPEPVDS